MRGRDALHALERLQATLRLARLRCLGAKALDERLHVADLALLAHEQRGLLRELGGALLLELRVVAAIRRCLAVLDVDDAIGDAVEELAIVGDEQQRAGVLAQPRLEPQDGVEVEMVGGLVEQQQVGAAHERARHVEAHAPAAGELGHGARLVGHAEAEAVHQRGGAGAGVVAAHAGEMRVEARPAACRRRRAALRAPRCAAP